MTKDMKLYKRKEVADILGIHPGTVFNWIKNGKIKATKIGRALRVKRSDLIKFIKENEVKSEKDVSEDV